MLVTLANHRSLNYTVKNVEYGLAQDITTPLSYVCVCVCMPSRPSRDPVRGLLEAGSQLKPLSFDLLNCANILPPVIAPALPAPLAAPLAGVFPHRVLGHGHGLVGPVGVQPVAEELFELDAHFIIV